MSCAVTVRPLTGGMSCQLMSPRSLIFKVIGVDSFHDEHRSQMTIGLPLLKSNLNSREYDWADPHVSRPDETVRCGSIWGGPAGTANLNVPPRSRFLGGWTVSGDATEVMIAKEIGVGSESFDLLVGAGCTVEVGSGY